MRSLMKFHLLLWLLSVSAGGISKREDGPSVFYKCMSIIFNMPYDDFINIEDQRVQLAYLMASAQCHPGIGEYIFTRLMPPQRFQILAYSTQIDRFTLYSSFSDNGRAILLRMMDEPEAQMIIGSLSSEETCKILEKYDDNGRIDFITRMGSRARTNWILGLNQGKMEFYSKYFRSDQGLMKMISHEFVRVRLQSMDSMKVKALKNVASFLDDLTEYFTRQELGALKASSDPIYFLTRFTPKERDAFRLLMNADEKKAFLDLKLRSLRQAFPGDFFGSGAKSKEFGVFSREDYWNSFWTQLVADVKLYEKISKSIPEPQRQIFAHRPTVNAIRSGRLSLGKVGHQKLGYS